MKHIKDNNLSNDDCMLEIFRKLNLKDLTSVVRVSKQFKKVAQQAFRAKYKKIYLSNHYRRLNKRRMHVIFSNFGHLMEEFGTASNFYPWFGKNMPIKMLKSIEKYCSRKGNRLKALDLRFFYNIDGHLNELNEIFTHLQKLDLEYTIIPGSLRQLLNKLPNAKEVTLNNCTPFLEFQDPITYISSQRRIRQEVTTDKPE